LKLNSLEKRDRERPPERKWTQLCGAFVVESGREMVNCWCVFLVDWSTLGLGVDGGRAGRLGRGARSAEGGEGGEGGFGSSEVSVGHGVTVVHLTVCFKGEPDSADGDNR